MRLTWPTTDYQHPVGKTDQPLSFYSLWSTSPKFHCQSRKKKFYLWGPFAPDLRNPSRRNWGRDSQPGSLTRINAEWNLQELNWKKLEKLYVCYCTELTACEGGLHRPVSLAQQPRSHTVMENTSAFGAPSWVVRRISGTFFLQVIYFPHAFGARSKPPLGPTAAPLCRIMIGLNVWPTLRRTKLLYWAKRVRNGMVVSLRRKKKKKSSALFLCMGQCPKPHIETQLHE